MQAVWSVSRTSLTDRQNATYHNANIHRSSKDTGTEAADTPRGDFRDVHRRNHGGLTNTQTGNKSARVHLAQSTVVRQEDDNTQDPKGTQLAGSPESTYSICKNEGNCVVLVAEQNITVGNLT